MATKEEQCVLPKEMDCLFTAAMAEPKRNNCHNDRDLTDADLFRGESFSAKKNEIFFSISYQSTGKNLFRIILIVYYSYLFSSANVFL